MSALTVLPQPWQDENSEFNESQYMTWALAQEAAGKTLVVKTLVNGHQAMDGGWVADYVIITDYRTGRELLAWDVDEVEPDYDYESLVYVRNELAAV